MKLRSIAAAAALVLLCFAAACSQSDGPMPTPQEDTANRLHDIARDLQNIAGGDKEGPKDFQDDLLAFLDSGEPHAQAQELSRRVSTSVAGKRMPDDVAAKLANQLWVAVAARELSSRQISTLQNDVQSTMQGVGVSAENAQQVAAQVGDVQKTLTHRHRRWYERA
jgi:hypothetical protein